MKKLLIIIILVFTAILFNINYVFAGYQCSCDDGSNQPTTDCSNCINVCSSHSGYTSGACVNVNEGSDSSQTSGATVKLENPLPNVTSPQVLIGNIIKAAMGIIGSLALAMFIFGGVLWMTSAGNAERVTKGKETILWATIGMIVIFAAYAVVNFIITSLG
jgi:hypothetical protein